MKILMLNSEYPPLGGGQGNANAYLLKFLSQYSDLRIDLITASAGRYKKEAYPLGERHFLDIGKRGKNLHHQSIKDLLMYSFKCFFFGMRMIRQHRYDMSVAWAGVPAGFIALLFKMIFRQPYIVLLRGADVPFYDKKWSVLDRFVFRYLSPLIWKRAEKVVANSAGLRDLALKTAPRQKINVIPNGIDLTDFYPTKKSSHKKFTVLYVGRLASIKGVDHLLKAFLDLSRHCDCQMLFAGEGPLKKDLESYVKKAGQSDSVIFLGSVPHDKLPDLYRSVDVFVSPSFNEGMSNALMEAMACGLPVVVSDTGGIQELLDGNWIIVEKASSGAILKALQDLEKDGAEGEKMASRGLKKIRNFSWEGIAAKYFQLFQDSNSF